MVKGQDHGKSGLESPSCRESRVRIWESGLESPSYMREILEARGEVSGQERPYYEESGQECPSYREITGKILLAYLPGGEGFAGDGGKNQ